jgi:5-formyltetrahydrofolate cyclo-ligase
VAGVTDLPSAGQGVAGDVAAQKKALRRQAMQQRSLLDGSARLAASRRALINLVNLLELRPNSMVAAFWPIGAELDTRPLFDVLAALGVTACLPRMAGPRQPLEFYPHRPGNALLEGPMRVLEPLPEGPALHPTIVIVPLLAFDHAGYRLGYGGGFYDRTLPTLLPSTVVVGLAFEAQQVVSLPHNATDARLKQIVTEAGVHKFA